MVAFIMAQVPNDQEKTPAGFPTGVFYLSR
jgi:hypothetical protein